MTFFDLKWGQDLENWAEHPHQEFPGVPHSGGQERGVNHVIIIIALNKTLDDLFRLLFTYRLLIPPP